MQGIPGTVTDRSFVEALEAKANPRLELHRKAIVAYDQVGELFDDPVVEAAGIVVSDALYEALAALSFVADWAEDQA